MYPVAAPATTDFAIRKWVFNRVQNDHPPLLPSGMEIQRSLNNGDATSLV
jgi:hypothetical protein